MLDSLGNVVSTADSLGQSTSYGRDAWFRVTDSTDPASAVTATSYDVFGNVRSVTDPLGNVTEYTYNDLDQLVTEGKVYTSGTKNRGYSYAGSKGIIPAGAAICIDAYHVSVFQFHSLWPD